jgi:hypothetical protein
MRFVAGFGTALAVIAFAAFILIVSGVSLPKAPSN